MSESNVPLHESPYPGVMRPEIAIDPIAQLTAQIEALTTQVTVLRNENASMRTELNALRNNEAATEPMTVTDEQDVKPRLRRVPGAMSQEKTKTREGRTKRVLGAIGAVAVLAAVGVGGYFIGKNDSDKKVSTSTKTEQTTAATGSTAPATSTEKLGSPAPVAAPAVAKVDPTVKMMAEVAKDKTVNEAVTDYKSGGIRNAFKNIFSNKGDFDHLKASHDQNKVSELAGRYANKVNPENVAEGIAISINGDKDVSKTNYNNLLGKRAGTSVEVDHAKRVNELENFLTSKDTKFSVENLSGAYYNAHINEADGTIGDKATNFSNIKVLKATDGKRTMIWKIGGGNDAEGEICLNPLLKVPSLPKNVIVKLPPHTPVGHNPRPRHPKPPVTTPPPTVTPIPQPKPPVTPSTGKDATKSPVTADPNNPIEALRPNIPAPAVAPQPVGAPEKDPYVVVAPVVGNTTRPDIVVDPRPEGTVATDTPVSSPNTNDAPATGVVTGP